MLKTPKAVVDCMLGAVAITSGANMDFDRLRFVSERADSSETMLAVRIPEVPGAFRALMRHIEPRNVTEFSYRYSDHAVASVWLSFQADGCADAREVLRSMAEGGLEVEDLRGNELAKSHLRHLGGGRAPVPHERLIRFEFPERPGALTHFLDSLSVHNGWNVSLFQYRNHGADIGRVLAGLQARAQLLWGEAARAHTPQHPLGARLHTSQAAARASPHTRPSRAMRTGAARGGRSDGELPAEAGLRLRA